MKRIAYTALTLPPDLSPVISRRQWVPFAALFAAYFITAFVGTYLSLHEHTFPGIIRPSAGVAIAGLVLAGRRLWPAIFLASILSFLVLGTSFVGTLLLSIAYTVQAVIGAWLLNWFGFNTILSRLRDAIALSITALLPTLIVPTVAVLADIYIFHIVAPGEMGSLWGPLWVGQIFSVMIITPLIVRWLSRFNFYRTRLELFEIGAAFLALIIATSLLFWTRYSSIEGVSLIYLLLVPLFWIALRIGPRFMTVALFLMALIEIAGVVLGPYGTDLTTLGVRLLQIEIFSSIIAFIFLVLVATIEERKDFSKALSKQVVRLEDALKRIRREDQAKSEFIAILAHELRNPLAPILSSIELLRMDELPSAERGKWLGVIEQHTHIMRRLLDDLLDISRISERKIRLEKERVNLVETVRLSLLAAHPLIESRNHDVSFTSSRESLLLEADPVRLEQIVVNLLNNAAKYTEPGGKIVVRADLVEDRVRLSVRDNGVGIAPHMLKRIFDPFIQAGNHKDNLAGLGIGLALTKQLVDIHGGSIEARSPGPGLGSEFILHLPAARRMMKPSQKRQDEPDKLKTIFPMQFAAQPYYRILIVDDNEAAAEGLAKLLEYRGHTVRLAHLASAALATASDFAPDIIILDIGLPDMDGYEVAKRLRHGLDSHAVLIALTGYGQYEDREQARAAGFDFHLTKPAGLHDLEGIFAALGKAPKTDTKTVK